MEKISALIDKLQELKNSNAGLQTISYYTQLLQAEILHQRNVQKQQELRGNGHVAVIMPAHTPVLEKQAPVYEPPAPEKAVPQPPAEKPVPASAPPAADKTPATNGNGYAPDRVPVKEKPVAATLFDPPQTPPQKNNTENGNIRQELNELVGKQATSLNDSLRANGKVEVGEKLSGLGVNDLKNAININDKFQFIQELFRGDKTMYERSIKTINEGTSLQEAENWIERELRIKLGWNENDQLVKHFYSLVRKRFS